MSRRPAQFRQAEIARLIRAAKQAGAAEIEISIGDQKVLIRLALSTAEENAPLAPVREFSL